MPVIVGQQGGLGVEGVLHLVREGLQGGVHRGELFCLGQSGVLQLTLQLEDLPQTEGSQDAGRSGKDKREKTGRMKWFHGASSYLCVAGL